MNRLLPLTNRSCPHPRRAALACTDPPAAAGSIQSIDLKARLGSLNRPVYCPGRIRTAKLASIQRIDGLVWPARTLAPEPIPGAARRAPGPIDRPTRPTLQIDQFI